MDFNTLAPRDMDCSRSFLRWRVATCFLGFEPIGADVEVTVTGGGSDGNFTAALGIPTLDGLGADGKGAHAAYEQIYFSSLMLRTYLCARLLGTLE